MPQELYELISSHLAGEERAAAKLVRAFRPMVTAQALRACGDPDMAEDAAQEALVKALSNVRRLRRTGRFAAWLATIARMWVAMQKLDDEGSVRAAHLVRRKLAGRWGTAALLDRLHVALAAARAGEQELLVSVLEETLASLRAEAGTPESPEAPATGGEPTDLVPARVSDLLGAIEGLVADRNPEAMYLLTLVSHWATGLFSSESLRLHRRLLAKRPMDVGHLGIVAAGWAFQGDEQRADQPLRYGLAQLPLRPCRTHTEWLPYAIAQLARGGRMQDALRYAREYVSQPWLSL